MLAGPAARMAAQQFAQKRNLPATAYITERMPAGSKSLERVPSLAADTVAKTSWSVEVWKFHTTNQLARCVSFVWSHRIRKTTGAVRQWSDRSDRSDSQGSDYR